MLNALVSPKAIAVIGASRTPGKVGHEIVKNLVAGGFAGTILPVNPSAKSLLGLTCYPDLKACPERPELSVIAVPSSAVKDAVVSSIDVGVEAITVISAGFRETGAAGIELEAELVRLCRGGGARLLGPNCLGLMNTHHCMNASFAKQMPGQGGISVFSQSGALCTAILDLAVGRHIGLAKLVSIGNKADISEIDLLQWFAEDDQTRVIVGYLESITSGADFVKVAEAASAIKPVVILKAGITESGVRAASSHTGSLAGANVAYGAAFMRSGVIRADTFEQLFDFAATLAMQPIPEGDRIAVITNAGGPGIMAADAIEQAGLTVAALASNTATALAQKLPAAASVGNPIDVLGDADPERYAIAFEAAQNDSSVDAIVVILTPQAMTLPAETARAIAKKMNGKKAVVASFMGGQDVMPGRAELVESNLPDYPSPERAVAALRAMCQYAAWRRRPPRVVTRFRVNRRRVERILRRHYRSRNYQIGEASSKEVMRAYGFPLPPGELTTTVEEAVEAAERIGYPVAIKIAAANIIHKSDFGGVRLNLTDAGAVRDAFDLMILRIQRRAPDVDLDGVYVEKMVRQGREIIIGMSRDSQFGPMLMFGMGGIFVEVMKDVSFHLAPITAAEAMRMLEGTRSFSLLQGVRGQASVDIESIATALQRISQLVTDFPQIAELDINPFIVGRTEADCVVADARITLAPPAESVRGAKTDGVV